MRNPILLKTLVVTAFVCFAAGAGALALRPRLTGTRQGKADENYVASDNCRSCHADHYASWRRTFHSTMTQAATPAAVAGDFTDKNTFEYLGVRATMERRGDAFFMKFTSPEGRTESVRIERTVGSRRIQQYLAVKNGQYTRLPVAYDLVRKRWMNLNGSFFSPDATNYNQHSVQWDTNCVFCHNVKAQPNFDFKSGTARTEVAELGIACGACHGRGAEHVDLASSPLTRASWGLGGGGSGGGGTRIVNPAKLDSDRATMVCGHCHGQRLPEPEGRIREILTADPFDAGGNLADFYKPVHADTKVGDVSFSSRFWPDASPRLTAYEYQGMTDSACFTKAVPGNRISCLSCHAMHDGDIRGNITEEKRSNAACTTCHTELAAPAKLAAHSGHDAASAGASCYSCHMPEVVYGVMSFHPTHKITIPDPSRTVAQGVPNACSQCHLDKSANWAVGEAKRLWPARFGGTSGSSDEQFDEPEGVRGLFAGDALMRALMADALGRRADPAWARPYLLASFEGENYPIVRYFASAPFDAPGGPARPDYLGDERTRASMLAPWISHVGSERMDEARRVAARLRALRRDVDIEVGE